VRNQVEQAWLTWGLDVYDAGDGLLLLRCHASRDSRDSANNVIIYIIYIYNKDTKKTKRSHKTDTFFLHFFLYCTTYAAMIL
jgi:hypothetical protein